MSANQGKEGIQGREGIQKQGRSSQETLVQPWGRVLVSPQVQFSHSVTSNSLQPLGLRHTRLPCPSPTPGAYSNSCLLSSSSRNIHNNIFKFFCRTKAFTQMLGGNFRLNTRFLQHHPVTLLPTNQKKVTHPAAFTPDFCLKKFTSPNN